MMLLRLLATVSLAALLGHADTTLVGGGKAVFKAAGAVTFGAVYSDQAVKATVVTTVPVSVTVNTGRAPTNVFLGEERLASSAWRFAAATGAVTLAVPGGTSTLQIRFDDVTDLKPFAAQVPVELVAPPGPDSGLGPAAALPGLAAVAGRMEVTVAAERVHGTFTWPGPEGLFGLRATQGGRQAAGVQVSASAPAGAEQDVLLSPGTVLLLSGDAPGQKLPVDRIEYRLLGTIAAMQSVDKGRLPWDGSTVVEAEAYKAEGGGTVSRSTEHGNTHGGACVFLWGAAGHWLSWEVTVPAAGAYRLTLLAATQEPEALRGIAIDDAPLAARALRFPGTGGWGRAKAEQWQAFQPVDGLGKPLLLDLAAGTHTLRLTNLLGQHLNLDCFLLTPVPDGLEKAHE